MMDGKQTKAVIGQTLITLCETKEVNKNQRTGDRRKGASQSADVLLPFS